MPNRFYNLIKKSKKWPYITGVALFLLIILLLPNSAGAESNVIMGTLISWVGSAMLLLINFLGTWLLLPLINLVIWIFSYNSFLTSNAVVVGWPLVRDLSNMFFVVILLFIAFATILNISNYSYKNTFFKLILMAILVNFSKTIMGFFIDFSQVIMLTFVSAFRDAAAVNLIHAFGIRDILKLNVNGGDFSNTHAIGVVILAVILLVVAIGLMLAFAVILLWRILTLWVLIILSPLAFLLSSIPAGQKYASEIWSKFTEQLVTGIALAFFTWLFFTVLAAGYSTDQQKIDNNSVLTGSNPGAGLTSDKTASIAGTAPISNDVDWERLYTFIVAIALLFLALEYAQKAGGHAGSMAGKISGHMSKIGAKTAGGFGLVGLGARSLPKKFDQGLVRFQKSGVLKRFGMKGLGTKLQERPISLRPTVIKEAIARYTKERESQYYTGVAEGMTDNLLKQFAGRKSDYAGIAYDSRVKEKAHEIGLGGETQEQMRAYLKEDHLEKYEGTDQDGNRVTKYKVKQGHEVEAEAILEIMTKNHDLNEIFKDQDIGAAYNNEYSAINVRDLIMDLFHDQGHEFAGRVAKDVGIVGFENKDAHLYGMGSKNVKTGEFEVFQETTRNEEGDESIVKKVFGINKKENPEEFRKKMDYVKDLRQRGAQGDKSAEKEYRGLVRDEWSVSQGALATAFMLKKGGRAGLGKITAQNIVDEGVVHDEQGNVQVGEDGETSRSFLTYNLNETGRGIIEKMAGVMTKEFSHIIDETKIYGINPALDTILKFAEAQTLASERAKIMDFVAKVAGMGEKVPSDINGVKIDSSLIKKQSNDYLQDEGYKKFKEQIVRVSQESRLISQGDARHARIDEQDGKWKRDRYSVFAEYENEDLTHKANGSNQEQSSSNAPSTNQPTIQAAVFQPQLARLDQINQRLATIADKIGQPPIDAERAILLNEKNGLEKQTSISVTSNLINNIISGNPSTYGPNWMKDRATRDLFIRTLDEHLQPIKDEDVRLHEITMRHLQESFSTLDDRFKNLINNEDAMVKFITEHKSEKK
ncbi:MAG: hypothetical protein WCV73_03910 [Patescibacteria group bacterium]|jgi:hypothetical protein